MWFCGLIVSPGFADPHSYGRLQKRTNRVEEFVKHQWLCQQHDLREIRGCVAHFRFGLVAPCNLAGRESPASSCLTAGSAPTTSNVWVSLPTSSGEWNASNVCEWVTSARLSKEIPGSRSPCLPLVFIFISHSCTGRAKFDDELNDLSNPLV